MGALPQGGPGLIVLNPGADDPVYGVIVSNRRETWTTSVKWPATTAPTGEPTTTNREPGPEGTHLSKRTTRRHVRDALNQLHPQQPKHPHLRNAAKWAPAVALITAAGVFAWRYVTVNTSFTTTGDR